MASQSALSFCGFSVSSLILTYGMLFRRRLINYQLQCSEYITFVEAPVRTLVVQVRLDLRTARTKVSTNICFTEPTGANDQMTFFLVWVSMEGDECNSKSMESNSGFVAQLVGNPASHPNIQGSISVGMLALSAYVACRCCLPSNVGSLPTCTCALLGSTIRLFCGPELLLVHFFGL